MKLNAGIITSKIEESKAFYTEVLNFGVTFQNDFYLLLHTSNRQAEISFLLPGHPSQQPLFHPEFSGKGMYLTIEVDDVDQIYQDIKQKGADILIDLRNEPWGDRHFAISPFKIPMVWLLIFLNITGLKMIRNSIKIYKKANV